MMEIKWVAIAMASVFAVTGIGMAVDKHGQHQVEIAKINAGKCK